MRTNWRGTGIGEELRRKVVGTNESPPLGGETQTEFEGSGDAERSPGSEWAMMGKGAGVVVAAGGDVQWPHKGVMYH